MSANMAERNESKLTQMQRAEESESLEAMDYDDSPWTREELEVLAWELVKAEEWDECDDGAGKS